MHKKTFYNKLNLPVLYGSNNDKLHYLLYFGAFRDYYRHFNPQTSFCAIAHNCQVRLIVWRTILVNLAWIVLTTVAHFKHPIPRYMTFQRHRILVCCLTYQQNR